MCRWKLPDILESSPGRERKPKCEDLVQSTQIERSPHARASEQRFDLGCKQKAIRRLRVKQRPDSHPVARQKQPAPPRVPDRERPLSIQPLHAVVAELLKQVQYNF